MPTLAEATRNAITNATVDLLDGDLPTNPGKLVLYEDSTDGVTLEFDDTASFGASGAENAGEAIAAGLPIEGVVTANITVNNAKLLAGDDTEVMSLTAGDNGEEVSLTNATLLVDDIVRLTAATVTTPASDS